MRDYATILKRLRQYSENCVAYKLDADFANAVTDAADAIEELLHIAAKMHTWIFLHTTDEQAAYDEIGLTDEQNALFGYSGQMILKAEPPKGVE